MSGKAFERGQELSLAAGVDEVWDAIATGPGIDSWYMGRNEVDPGPGGAVRTAFGDYAPVQPITAWEPGRRLAYGSPAEPDGRFIAYEFLLEGRSGGSTVLRVVTSGFLPGDDWEEEYRAMATGGATFLATLEAYVEHFRGRTAVPVTAVGAPIADWAATRPALHSALGLRAEPAVGDRCAFADPVDGSGRAVEATVYVVTADSVGLRTPDALLRFVRGGLGGPLLGMHHLFGAGSGSGAGSEIGDVGAAWGRWLRAVA